MEHTHQWAELRLQAYHDGELDARASERISAHLTDCAICREELATLASLSSLLQAVPPAQDLMPEDRFVASVGLRLSRRPTVPLSERVIDAGWRWAPALLVGLWAFFQAVSWMTTGILTLSSLGVGSPWFDRLPQVVTRLLSIAGLRWDDRVPAAVGLDVLGDAIAALGLGNLSLTLVHFGFYIVLGLAIWSWAASWWARERHRQLEQLTSDA
jgi:hypothetical protein